MLNSPVLGIGQRGVPGVVQVGNVLSGIKEINPGREIRLYQQQEEQSLCIASAGIDVTINYKLIYNVKIINKVAEVKN